MASSAAATTGAAPAAIAANGYFKDFIDSLLCCSIRGLCHMDQEESVNILRLYHITNDPIPDVIQLYWRCDGIVNKIDDVLFSLDLLDCTASAPGYLHKG